MTAVCAVLAGPAEWITTAPGRPGAKERANREYVRDEPRSRTGCVGGLDGSGIPARTLRSDLTASG